MQKHIENESSVEDINGVRNTYSLRIFTRRAILKKDKIFNFHEKDELQNLLHPYRLNQNYVPCETISENIPHR
jgi:hypothetical protein